MTTVAIKCTTISTITVVIQCRTISMITVVIILLYIM